ncbi:MAG TPA: hypothetical protein VMP11_01520, partial [Verrucomicrobiae bacterium]|nr:hypothetical protein [Verrucomicrobiae bacterium]
ASDRRVVFRSSVVLYFQVLDALPSYQNGSPAYTGPWAYGNASVVMKSDCHGYFKVNESGGRPRDAFGKRGLAGNGLAGRGLR